MLRRTQCQAAFFILVALVLLSVTGCTTAPMMIDPVDMVTLDTSAKATMRPVTVSDMILTMDNDGTVGHGHQGLLNIQNDTFYAGSKFSEGHQLIMTTIEDELSQSGFNVIMTAKEMFTGAGEAKDPNVMLIGGEVIDFKYDRYESVGGQKTKAEATVIWKLYDQQSESVVFTIETSGKAEGPKNSMASLAFAVKSSFRKFLTDDQLLTLVGATRTMSPSSNSSGSNDDE